MAGPTRGLGISPPSPTFVLSFGDKVKVDAMLRETYPNLAALGLVYFHIMAGFLAMFAGLVPWFTPKGGRSHRVYGMVFVVSMGLASLTGIPLGFIVGHWYQVILSLFGLSATLSGLALARQSLKDWWGPAQVFTALLAVGGLVSFVFLPHLYPGAPGRVVVMDSLWIIALTILSFAVKKEQRRIVQHLFLTTTALILAWSAYFNTQLHRFVGFEVQQEIKMTLPLFIALLPLIYMAIKHRNPQPKPVDSQESPFREQFRIISKGEGFSLLLLLFVAVPLKRLMHLEGPVMVLGPIHGTLTMIYAVQALLLWRSKEVTLKQGFILLVLCVVPFGWIFAEKVLGQKQESVHP